MYAVNLIKNVPFALASQLSHPWPLRTLKSYHFLANRLFLQTPLSHCFQITVCDPFPPSTVYSHFNICHHSLGVIVSNDVFFLQWVHYSYCCIQKILTDISKAFWSQSKSNTLLPLSTTSRCIMQHSCLISWAKGSLTFESHLSYLHSPTALPYSPLFWVYLCNIRFNFKCTRTSWLTLTLISKRSPFIDQFKQLPSVCSY